MLIATRPCVKSEKRLNHLNPWVDSLWLVANVHLCAIPASNLCLPVRDATNHAQLAFVTSPPQSELATGQDLEIVYP